ncbi:OLC1v1020334C1 [Oldenlandia corymbosa var. corymbosa]|uniref:Glycosyltransferase n=1 Tax=Oldenlandia corymbosa var. corymbosa TaxID=529605 RepID=A0AAV1EG56_OLDCO|nr:OLC1v1020334C1 [Oldenlandia corymbosa var. corymbosa]
MESNETEFRVIMVPWLAHGHISPFLELAKVLILRKFSVFFCSTPVNLDSIKPKLPKTPSDLPINFVELHLPSLSELPPHLHTTNGLPAHLMSTLIRALEMASSSFSGIIDSVQPHIIIYDIYQSWVPQVALVYNIPAVHFQTTGATASAFYLRMFKHRGVQFPSPRIFLREYEIKKMSRAESTLNDGKDKDRVFDCIDQSSDVILIKSCRELEGNYIDFLSLLTKKNIFPVGSLVHDSVEDDDSESLKIKQWLNKKPHASTVFVSFGSECFLSKEELEQIANGLDCSNVNFIWAIRFPAGSKESLEESLPAGYLDRVKGKGLVFEGWAPQVKILTHSSIGGFVSHCGWSSMMESLYFGVPIIAMPMQLDQPLNARLVVEIGAGKEVIRDEKGLLNAEEIARVVKEVVMGNEGLENRRKAREFGERIRANADKEINAAVEQLVKLCEKAQIKS